MARELGAGSAGSRPRASGERASAEAEAEPRKNTFSECLAETGLGSTSDGDECAGAAEEAGAAEGAESASIEEKGAVIAGVKARPNCNDWSATWTLLSAVS